MARKKKTDSPYAALPTTRDGLEDMMRQRWAETDADLERLVSEERRIEKTLISRRTRRGTALSARGLSGLLHRLRSVHYGQTLAMMEGGSLAKRCAILQHNRMHEIAARVR